MYTVVSYCVPLSYTAYSHIQALHFLVGDILLDLNIEDLMEIGLKSRVQGKWMMEQIRQLRCRADVSALDRQNIGKFLTDIHRGFSVYRVDFARKGIPIEFIPSLTEDMLVEIGVHSAVDRARILQASETCATEMVDSDASAFLPPSPRHKKKYDVFISYRRQSGAQLASLLKVHLQTQGISTFLDVSSLGGGKFDDNLLTTLSQSSNIVVILTPNCLQRCIGDLQVQDWLHRELVCALDHEMNIVPLCDPDFTWPRKDQLPEDLHPFLLINSVTWRHEYQEATIEKLINFLNISPLLRRKSIVKAI